LLLLAALVACDPPTIPGRDVSEVYDFTLDTQPPRVLRWPSGTNVRVWIEPAAAPGRIAVLEEAFRVGSQGWNEQAVFAEYRIVRARDLGTADVVLMWSDAVPPVDTRNCRPAVTQAVTTFCVDGLTGPAPRLRPYPLPTGEATDVRMLVTILAGEAGRADLVRRLVAHEFGHVLGIGRHSSDPDDLMWRTDPVVERPGPRDAATVQLLYHVRPQILP
jgi:hypothetical protein